MASALNERVRRAIALICYFEGCELTIENYLTGDLSVTHPALISGLAAINEPMPTETVLDRLGGAVSRSIVDQLIEQNVLLIVGTEVELRDRDVDLRWPWGLPARYFHYNTRRTVFGYDLAREREDLLARARVLAQPAPFKDYGTTDFRLPDPEPTIADFSLTLASRRTGRSFSNRALDMPALATILHSTWGITEMRDDPGVGVVALKTSPSGGARHPTEVYCIAQNVAGLRNGVYHYCAGRHALSRLPDVPATESRLLDALTGQPWVADAAAVFFMTAVIQRSAWKYPQAHAYRVLLLDAGHLGQTFHLTCSALGLSPWTSAAIDEEAAEDLLGLNDPAEIVLYAAACGWAA